LAAGAYVEFARKAFAREATYRMEVFTLVGSLILRVYLLRSLWTALYAQNAEPPGLPLHSMITYATVALLMSLVLEVDGTRLIRERVREGTIATDLMKPISVPIYFFSDGLGQTLLHALLIVPSLLFALLLVHVDVPPPQTLAAFAFAFLLGYGVNFFINFLMNSVAFWTLETFAMQLIVRWGSDLLSGQIIPLMFFPGALGRFVFALRSRPSIPRRCLSTSASSPRRSGRGTSLSKRAGLRLSGYSRFGSGRRRPRRIVVQGG